MTALAGCWNYGGKPPPGQSCERMLAAQRIYGPHDGRQWSDGTIAMGRQLFRTLPEDIHDRQPLVGGDGTLTLVADVRLDNREELAGALGLGSERQRGLCDAALLLLCLEQWREGALDRLVGDFAFALWDSRRQELMLARDFIGQRPLHYHRGDGFFAFASMPKGLHALPEVPYAPDEQMAAEFLALLPQWGARTFFKGIEAVEAGHVVKVTRERLETRRYWNPLPPPRRGKPGHDYIEGLRHHLDEAVRVRLRGAGPAVASHLSAGLDSSAVTATAARLMAPDGGNVVAFTSVPREGYDGPAPENRLGDEGPLAAETAAFHPNIEHIVIHGDRRSPLADLDRYFLLFDRPQLNLCNMVWASAINDAAKARKLTVLLTGQMGNMTISYNGAERLAELLRAGRLLSLAREGGKLAASGAMTGKSVIGQSLGAYFPAGLWKWLAQRRNRDMDIREYSAISPERLDSLGLDRLARERDLDPSYRPRKNGFDTRLWVMRRVDPGPWNKGTLAGWGIDQRDPTADRRLAEYCLSVPMEQYLGNGRVRSLGKRALADRLPAVVLDSRRKGYQAVDWHEGLSAARADADEELTRLTGCGPAADALDLARMRRLAAHWPDSGWERQSVINAYRLALLRGISVGHFLRKASGSNQ